MQVPRPRDEAGRPAHGRVPVALADLLEPRLVVRRPEQPPTVRIGRAELACIPMPAAVSRVRELAAGPRAALVVTANADHIVRMERDEELAAAYAEADLAVIDGQPLVWTAAMMRIRTPRVAGVDLFEELCGTADPELRLFLLGGSEWNSARAEQVLAERFPQLDVVGRDTSWVSEESTPEIVAKIRASRANVVAVFYGCPKQERWVAANRADLPPGAYLCLGGTVDIVSGALPRAGLRWQRLGLEWLHRLLLEPTRLWRRYLVDDARYAVVALRSVRRDRRKR